MKGEVEEGGKKEAVGNEGTVSALAALNPEPEGASRAGLDAT